MIRCSCQGLQGWVPAAQRSTSKRPASSRSWRRRSPIVATASANDSQRPVRTSISEAISSPTRCSSSSEPRAAACSSSKRFTRPERLGIEESELLLDGEREVLSGLESLSRSLDLLVRSQSLGVSHGPESSRGGRTVVRSQRAESSFAWILTNRSSGGHSEATASRSRALVERHERRLYTLAARVLGSRDEAADAVQDALLRAWLGLPKFRGGSLFSTWLYRICVNAAHDARQKRRDTPGGGAARAGGSPRPFREPASFPASCSRP